MGPMTLVALNGSHSAASSTHAVAALAVELHGSGQVVDLVTLDPAGLIGTATRDDVQAVLAAIEAASILVLVTPIYRATYSGLLKVLFDQLPGRCARRQGRRAGGDGRRAGPLPRPRHGRAGARRQPRRVDGADRDLRHARRLRRGQATRPTTCAPRWRKALAEAAMLVRVNVPRTIDEFAAAARDWLAEHRAEAPPDYGAICPPELIDAGVAWQRLLTTSGYAGIHWPVEHGGQGLTPEHQAAWLIECALAGVPPVLNMVGLVLAGGALLRYGTPEQQAQHLRADAGGRPRVVPAVLRARRRQRPRSLVDPGRARRRPLRRQRPEGVVLRRAGQRLGHPDGPHEPRGRQARRHLVLPLPDGPARHRGPPAQADDRRRRSSTRSSSPTSSCRPTACSARCTAGGASG